MVDLLCLRCHEGVVMKSICSAATIRLTADTQKPYLGRQLQAFRKIVKSSEGLKSHLAISSHRDNVRTRIRRRRDEVDRRRSSARVASFGE